MANNLAANTPIKYSLKLVEILYNDTIYTKVTNTNYEGEIKSEGDRVRVRTLGKLTLQAYTKGTTLVAQDLAPSYEDLIIDKQYYFKFIVDDIDKLQNDIDTINEYAQISKRDMQELLDTDILTYMASNADYDNVIGTSYSAGNVTVTTGTGAVVGLSGATFTAGMVGGYFKATGHADGKSYIVTSFTNATNIVIADQGEAAGTYTGGTITTAAYVIKAATPVEVTKSTVYKQLVDLRTKLGNKKTPKEGRFIVVNSEFEGVLLQAPEFIPAVGAAYEDAVKGARIGRIAGFDIYTSELVVGSNTSTTGFWFVAGTRDYCAMALQIMKTNIIDSANSENTFVTTCKGLLVWGRKVFAGNRGRGAVLRAYLS
jgi:hypothetical protein